MYPKLDPEYIKEVKRENRTRQFGLSNYLPNSLKRDRSIEGISNYETSVGSGLYKAASRSTLRQFKQETERSLTRNQPKLNRLASLSELESIDNNVTLKTLDTLH